MGYSVVKENKLSPKKSSGVRTTIPICCFLILDVEEPTHIKWERTGKYFKISPCEYDLDASTVRIQINKSNHRATIPKVVAGQMGAKLGKVLVWYVVTDGHSNWQIQVEVEK